jgi:hypothetical protein
VPADVVVGLGSVSPGVTPSSARSHPAREATTVSTHPAQRGLIDVSLPLRRDTLQ